MTGFLEEPHVSVVEAGSKGEFSRMSRWHQMKKVQMPTGGLFTMYSPCIQLRQVRTFYQFYSVHFILSAHFSWDIRIQGAKIFLVFLGGDQNLCALDLWKRETAFTSTRCHLQKESNSTPHMFCDYITDDYLLYCGFLHVLVSSLHYKEHLILGNINLGLFLFLWYKKWSMENEEKQRRGFNYRGQSIKFSPCELRLCIYSTNFGNLC